VVAIGREVIERGVADRTDTVGIHTGIVSTQERHQRAEGILEELETEGEI